MRSPLRFALAAALLGAAPLPAAAQQPTGAAQRPTNVGNRAAGNVAADLLTDIGQVEKKVMGLARAIPADKYAWRPAPGVRSIGEALMHVAADNYLLPASIGNAADSASAIKGGDYKAAQAYERRQLDRDATIAELERSFAYLRKSLTATPAARFGEQVSLFGQTFTLQQTWIMTTTHLHEHLGQLIAYARSTGVVPPWSQGG